jgi:hypothetical protein
MNDFVNIETLNGSRYQIKTTDNWLNFLVSSLEKGLFPQFLTIFNSESLRNKTYKKTFFFNFSEISVTRLLEIILIFHEISGNI